jgi:hypothetical protein
VLLYRAEPNVPALRRDQDAVRETGLEVIVDPLVEPMGWQGVGPDMVCVNGLIPDVAGAPDWPGVEVVRDTALEVSAV